MRGMKSIVVVLLGLYALAGVAPGAEPIGVWVPLPPMSVARQELASAEIYGYYLYTIGGQGIPAVERYDIYKGIWERMRNLPVTVDHNVAIGLNGLIYHFGGSTQRAFVYEPFGDEWYDITPPRYQHGGTAAIGVLAGHIILAGGTGGGMVGNEVELYDAENDLWYDLPPMNVARNHIAGGVINGKFYVAGGRPGTLDVLEEFDPATMEWIRKAPMPTARSGVGAAVVNNRLYVFGGEMPGIFEQVEAYDPATDTWTSMEPMPTPRHGIMAVAIDNWIFIAGGATRQGGGSATTANEAFVVFE